MFKLTLKNEYFHVKHVIKAFIHTGATPYSCSLCPQSFHDSTKLKRHIRRSHSENLPETLKNRPRFPCAKCDKTFSYKSNLSTHLMRIHSENIPSGPRFPCTECKKIFSCKSNLSTHMNMHKGIKPYTCQICERAFSIKRSLTKHHCKKNPDQKSTESISKLEIYTENPLYHHTKHPTCVKDWETENDHNVKERTLLVQKECSKK